MSELEKQQIKTRLTEVLDKFITDETAKDNNIGWLPENIEALMADAAFSVLMTVTATNEFFESEGLFKV